MTAPTDRRAKDGRPTDRYRPSLRPGVLVSDAFLLGARTVHLVKNPGAASRTRSGSRNTS